MHRMKECIEACVDCHRVCQEALAHFLRASNGGVSLECMSDLMDCSEACALCTNFMLRGSQHHTLSCEICAEICSACAESCESIGGDRLAACAEACRRCSELCGEMSVHA